MIRGPATIETPRKDPNQWTEFTGNFITKQDSAERARALPKELRLIEPNDINTIFTEGNEARDTTLASI